MPTLGSSDHNVVLLDFASHIYIYNPRRRVIYLWKKAKINRIENQLADKLDAFNNTKFTEINSMWIYIKDLILCVIKEHVSTKSTHGKHTHPWINADFRRLGNRKQKSYSLASPSKTTKDQK
jgi:hypothetical protein